MVAKRKEETPAPRYNTLQSLAEASEACRNCDLYKYATQVVFGQGSPRAKIMLIGEQPGNAEDQAGQPFVGPAGKILDKALEQAGIPRSTIYSTNAVKHFKFQERGKRRLHKTPRVIEVEACFPWLEGEIKIVKPEVIVCLGATAVRAVLGRTVKVLENRGKLLESERAPYMMITVHPSSVLRIRDHEVREKQLALLVEDLKMVAKIIERGNCN